MAPLVVDSLSETDSEDITSYNGSGTSRSCTKEEKLIAAYMRSCRIVLSSYHPGFKDHPIDLDGHEGEEESKVKVLTVDMEHLREHLEDLTKAFM